MKKRFATNLSILSMLLLVGCGDSETSQEQSGGGGSFQPETGGGGPTSGGQGGGQSPVTQDAGPKDDASEQPGAGGGGGAGASGGAAASGGAGGGDSATAPIQCERWVLTSGAVNARDLGGHPLSDGRRVACGAFLHGGALFDLGELGCAEFEQLGIQTVIDLREDSVHQDSPASACVSDNATVVNAAMPQLLPDTPENYLALFDETASVGTIFEILGAAESFPVYIHCIRGRDRVAFVTALVLLALGAERQTVIDEFMLSEQGDVPVKQECIEAVLDEIDNRGGIEAYLSSAGVTPEQLETLRAQAIAP